MKKCEIGKSSNNSVLRRDSGLWITKTNTSLTNNNHKVKTSNKDIFGALDNNIIIEEPLELENSIKCENAESLECNQDVEEDSSESVDIVNVNNNNNGSGND